jgi:glucuronate isomerase
MNAFMTENFLLHSPVAERLYHDHAREMPIYDYHCHLPVEEIAQNRQFDNLTQIWLDGDHYKWRAMRANGVLEQLITGDADDRQKFAAWAATVPATLRNPLYHWTHLELRRTFGIEDLLNAESADRIYDQCSEMLRDPAFSTRGLLRSMNVRLVCTTDDPVDDLQHHQQIAVDNFDVKVYPAFRPDAALGIHAVDTFNAWIARLEKSSGTSVGRLDDFRAAIQQRHAHFHATGCRLSDHGIDEPYAAAYTEQELNATFDKARAGNACNANEILQFRSAMLYEFAVMDHAQGWVQQYHLGALRNVNSRLLGTLGPDTGFDSIGDFDMARPLARFLDRLDAEDKLAPTVLYNLNPRDNEVMATMIGNFMDGSRPGKLQFGSGWWYLDQKDGMTRQINALSNMGLLSRFVGMLTDSRSFLSYPRHEYFRRVLCNLLGKDVVNGELPEDFDLLGGLVQDVCWNNAVNYFGMDVGEG